MIDESTAPWGHDPGIDSHRAAAISPAGGLRAALRALEPLLGAQAMQAAGSAASLERSAFGGDPPSVSSCAALERPKSRPMSIAAAPGVTAFLDGVQRSRVLGHVAGAPIVFATVAAAIRQRHEKRLGQWHAPLVRHLVLASRVFVGEAAWTSLQASGLSPIDVSAAAPNAAPLHPLAVRALALDVVAEEREALERRLAAAWCRSESSWLWIDGGVTGSVAVDAQSPAFGVVKSHHTLYGDGDGIGEILTLPVAERSPLFLVQHRARRAVASWYLRLHRSADGDPLHGLVRVEVAPPPTLFRSDDKERAHPDALGLGRLVERADTISGWILAERAPIALPDGRWDTLTYGVYACEQYLKALIGS